MGTKAPGPVTRLHFPAPCPSHHLSLPAAFPLGLLHPRFPSRSITLATRTSPLPSFPPFSEPTELMIDPRGAFHSRSPEDSKYIFLHARKFDMRADIASQQRQERAEAWPSSRKKRAGRQKGRGGVKGTEKKKQRGRKKWEEKKFLFRL